MKYTHSEVIVLSLLFRGLQDGFSSNYRERNIERSKIIVRGEQEVRA
jgi:hypothetical protein